jgi:hypothetical protein
MPVFFVEPHGAILSKKAKTAVAVSESAKSFSELFTAFTTNRSHSTGRGVIEANHTAFIKTTSAWVCSITARVVLITCTQVYCTLHIIRFSERPAWSIEILTPDIESEKYDSFMKTCNDYPSCIAWCVWNYNPG